MGLRGNAVAEYPAAEAPITKQSASVTGLATAG